MLAAAHDEHDNQLKYSLFRVRPQRSSTTASARLHPETASQRQPLPVLPLTLIQQLQHTGHPTSPSILTHDTSRPRIPHPQSVSVRLSLHPPRPTSNRELKATLKEFADMIVNTLVTPACSVDSTIEEGAALKWIHLNQHTRYTCTFCGKARTFSTLITPTHPVERQLFCHCFCQVRGSRNLEASLMQKDPVECKQ
ncbi:hypothetical protein BKA83DRAFT_4128208 [Pisolithus microcarpus]|nr:hypothetical protein BKA83DRAFT_4128208 [Pisolithus microcarpus]